MKKLLFIALSAFVVFAAASCSKYKYETVNGDPTGARIYTLDNGLTVYLIENHDQPRIAAWIPVRVGSKNDPQETTGLAHYFEHLMFKGTQQFGTQNYEAEKPLLDEIEQLFEVYRKTTDEAERQAIYHQIDSISYEASKISIPNEYDKLMAAIGAQGTNAFTSYDVTCYTENIPSNQIENWAKIQADRFQNCVLRGFHTELETIYEEYNMYASRDDEKKWDAFFGAMFESHPYHTPVIGWPEHLKNPSITNVKNYHDKWYVPNNMAVCLAGDFNPDEAIAIIDKYFGALKPNNDLQKMEFEPEKRIEAPVVKEVCGLESPSVMLGWRFPGANDTVSVYLDLLEHVLNNGTAGLIDIDVNQQQKTLKMYAGNEQMADYSAFIIDAEPKEGQSLEEVRDIALAELAKVAEGDFDEELLAAVVNNMKRDFIKGMESPYFLVSSATDCFINGKSWADFVTTPEKIAGITKNDLAAFVKANFKDNYVQINKLQGKDPKETKIAKPAITPIFTNRDTASAFLKNIQACTVKPIEPVFVDYSKDMKIVEAKSGIPVLYKKNESNQLFSLTYLFDAGKYADNKMPVLTSYLPLLGTSTKSAEQVQKAFYSLACDFDVRCTGSRTYITLSGLSENMAKAVDLMEELVSDAQPDDAALEQLKANTILERRNNMLDQRYNFSALVSYAEFGPVNPYTSQLSGKEIAALTSAELIDRIHGLFGFEHQILYYGPMGDDEIVKAVNDTHKCPEVLAQLPVKGNPFMDVMTPENVVLLADYDANQSYIESFSNRGEMYDAAAVPSIEMYNEYFGGGMGSIVFQEMREARGLAYSAAAEYELPDDAAHYAYFSDFIATQNDKVIDALTAFDEIINNMPVSEGAFNIAKESLLTYYRTNRIIKEKVLWSYLKAKDLGIDYDIRKDCFEKISGFTMNDVVSFQQNTVKGRNFTIAILGRQSDLDLKALEKFGKVKILTKKDIFAE